MIERSLTRAVRRQEWPSSLRGRRADVQNLAATAGRRALSLLLHHASGALRREQRAVEVHGENPLPGFQWKVQKGSDVEDTGVVDQHIQSSKSIRDTREHLIL